jgi:hypothetical protein
MHHIQDAGRPHRYRVAAANFPGLSSMSLAGFSGTGNMQGSALADTYNPGLSGVKQFLNDGFDPDFGTTGENYGQTHGSLRNVLI